MPEPQDHSQATYVKKISKTMGDIDWSLEAETIERLVRGLNPWPSAYTRLQGKMLKIWKARVLPQGAVPEAAPGTVLGALGGSLTVQTGRGILEILELQLEGKKRMDAAAFLRGFPVEAGAVMERSE